MSVDDERPTGRASTRSTIERVALGVVLACLLEGCAPKRIALPGDPGAPLSGFDQIHAAISDACRGVRTLTGELRLSGRAGDQPLRGTVLAAFSRPASMRLDLRGPFGMSYFVLTANAAGRCAAADTRGTCGARSKCRSDSRRADRCHDVARRPPGRPDRVRSAVASTGRGQAARRRMGVDRSRRRRDALSAALWRQLATARRPSWRLAGGIPRMVAGITVPGSRVAAVGGAGCRGPHRHACRRSRPTRIWTRPRSPSSFLRTRGRSRSRNCVSPVRCANGEIMSARRKRSRPPPVPARRGASRFTAVILLAGAVVAAVGVRVDDGAAVRTSVGADAITAARAGAGVWIRDRERVSARSRGLYAGADLSRRVPVREHGPVRSFIVAEGRARDGQGRATAARGRPVFRRRADRLGHAAHSDHMADECRLCLRPRLIRAARQVHILRRRLGPDARRTSCDHERREPRAPISESGHAGRAGTSDCHRWWSAGRRAQ